MKIQSNFHKNGLTSARARDLLLEYGSNVLPVEEKPWWYFLIRQYTGLFSYALVVIALFYYMTSSYAEAILVLSICIVNGLLAFWQEYRSDNSYSRQWVEL